MTHTRSTYTIEPVHFPLRKGWVVSPEPAHAPMNEAAQACETMPVPRSAAALAGDSLERSLGKGEPVSWESFLDVFAATIYGLVVREARTYDGRMDLFLFVCEALAADGMRRVRAYRYRPDAPCRFATYLTVVVSNLVRDFHRSRRGRFRPFTSTAKLDAVDRLILVLRFQEERSLDDLVRSLEARHGVSLPALELAERIARVERSLTPGQRWRLLARRAWRSPALPLDGSGSSAVGGARGASRGAALASSERDPERSLGTADAERAFAHALATLSGRQQLVLVLRFRDGLDVAATAQTIGLSNAQVERLSREGLSGIRGALGAAGVTRDDLEAALAAGWSSWSVIPKGRRR